MPATTSAAKAKAPAPHEEDHEHPGLIHLPTVHVPRPHVGMPTGTTGRVLWWGGLAAVAAFGVIDWPVAAAVGVGSWVAEQYAKADRGGAED